MASPRDMRFSGADSSARELLEALSNEFERLVAENHKLLDAVSRMNHREDGDDVVVLDELLSSSASATVVEFDRADDTRQLPGRWLEGVGWVEFSGADHLSRKSIAPAMNPPTMTSSVSETHSHVSGTKAAWGSTISASSSRSAMSKFARATERLITKTKMLFPRVSFWRSNTGMVARASSRTSLSTEIDPQTGNPMLRRGLFNRRSVGPMFPDADDMKKVVKSQLNRKKRYTVESMYLDHGVWQRIARSHWFENLTIIIIGLNSIWIAIDTDHNNADMLIDAHPVFMVAEQFFCLFFSIELLIRLFAFQEKKYALTDAWFVFDLSLVCLMITESWILVAATWILSFDRSGDRQIGNASILRLAKLLRIMRMLRISRLMRTMPEFSIILKALSAAFRAVFFTLFFLVVILYVIGIAFTGTLKDTDMENQFPSVLKSMQRLFFQVVLFDDILELVLDLSDTDSFALFLLYVLATLAGITIMNMLIGVLCEAVQAVADSERTSLHVVRVQASLQKIISQDVDQDHDGLISKQEFMRLISSQEAVLSLEDIGVDVVGLVDIADTIFANQGFDNRGDKGEVETYDRRITFEEFMDVLLQLRGSNKATVRDIVELRKEVHIAMRKLETIGNRLCHSPSVHFMQSLRQPLRAAAVARNKSQKTTASQHSPRSDTVNVPTQKL